MESRLTTHERAGVAGPGRGVLPLPISIICLLDDRQTRDACYVLCIWSLECTHERFTFTLRTGQADRAPILEQAAQIVVM
jgi:hypothetical protein